MILFLNALKLRFNNPPKDLNNLKETISLIDK